jgi:26S proteasome regulatory subunit T1
MEKIFSYAFTTAGRSSEDDHGGGGPYAAQHIGGVAAVDSGGATGMFGEIVSKGLQTGIGSTLSGLGYGLPMSRLYASYFGGSLHLMPLEGWGTDVFIKVRSLKEAEHISS